MEIRTAIDPEHAERLGTDELRRHFLIEGLFEPGALRLVYTHSDRAIVGSAVPLAEPIALEAPAALRAAFFAERRELGAINVGGHGSIGVDGQSYALAARDALYIGRGSREIHFASQDAAQPARFYLVSYPAHASHPTTCIRGDAAERNELGSQANANRRTLAKYIHPAGVPSCQLVMGMTSLDEGSVWNTMPAHTHDRRSEIYLYLGLAPDAVVLHLMGRGQETRHLVVRDGEAVISPSWSIHAGAGTRSYSFVWAMGGENQEFADMDPVPTSELR
jgi:4-deoxy-L-threo-5-hexosulose-uronate ketol-isomerase